MTRTAPKNTQLCHITIDYVDLVMPVADGMKLLALLPKAVRVERTYEPVSSRGHRITFREQKSLEVQFNLLTQMDVFVPLETASTSRKAQTGAKPGSET